MCVQCACRATQDEVVPPEHMARLFATANASRRRTIARFPTGMHNDTWTKTGYVPEIAKFVRDVAAPRCST